MVVGNFPSPALLSLSSRGDPCILLKSRGSHMPCSQLYKPSSSIKESKAMGVGVGTKDKLKGTNGAKVAVFADSADFRLV